MFADPFYDRRPGDRPDAASGFRLEVHDIYKHTKISFDCPEEVYDMPMFIGSPNKYTVNVVYSRGGRDHRRGYFYGAAVVNRREICRR